MGDYIGDYYTSRLYEWEDYRRIDYGSCLPLRRPRPFTMNLLQMLSYICHAELGVGSRI